jgi:hypothetical protein
MNRSLIITVLLGMASAVAASPHSPQDAEAMGRVIDPLVDVILPNGPGSAPGQEQSTHSNCAMVERSSGVVAANLTWTWVWLPTEAGRRGHVTDEVGSCPCAWKIKSARIQYTHEGQPLAC